MFSSDPEILRWQSEPMQRMKEYGELFDKLVIFLLTREGGKSYDVSERVRVEVFSGRFGRFFKAAVAAYRLSKEENISVITTQEVEHALVAYVLKPIMRARWQMQIHSDIFNPQFKSGLFFNWLRSYFAKFLIPRADCLRVVSERIKRSLQTNLPNLKTNISVLPIFVEVERLSKLLPSFDLREKYKEFDFITLMVSRLTREKNIGLALEALAEITKKEQNVGLVIVGEGPERKNLESRIENLGLTKNVKFEGWSDDLVSYYKTADLYLLTSNYEGYGRTVIEALACNLPVIMTDVGVAGEAVLDRKNGIIVPAGEFLGIATEILKLIQNKNAYDSLKKNTHPLFAFPSKEEYLERFRSLLESCS